MAEMRVNLYGQPTPFARFVVRYWVIGILLCPFFRFMPPSWFVKVEMEDISNG